MLAVEKIKVLAVVGPTATGKTRLAVELALSMSGEVVSADSMQVYKGLQIGTAKPTLEEMRGVPHHLIDFVELGEQFSVADYVRLAARAIEEIHQRKKLPIVCGGTGLYISSLLDNISFSKAGKDEQYRAQLREIARQHGGQALLHELEKVDAQCAKRLHPNNIGRVIRALEIYKLTGKTMTQHIKESRLKPSPYNTVIIGLNYKNRALLYDKIEKRVDTMLEKGLLDEAKELFSKNAAKTVLQAIGYKEFFPFLRNEISLDEAVAKIKLETKRYAKRQLTWFNRDKRIKWIYIDDYDSFDKVKSAALQLACWG